MAEETGLFRADRPAAARTNPMDSLTLVALLLGLSGLVLLIAGVVQWHLSRKAPAGSSEDSEPLQAGAPAAPLTALTTYDAVPSGCPSAYPLALYNDMAAINGQQFSCNDAPAWAYYVDLLRQDYPAAFGGDLLPSDDLQTAGLSSACGPAAEFMQYMTSCWQAIASVPR
jgi:hypothetical protein